MIAINLEPLILSLAGIVRNEYDTNRGDEMRARTTTLFKVAKQLKWLSDTFKLAVIVVNQVKLLPVFLVVDSIKKFFEFIIYYNTNFTFSVAGHCVWLYRRTELFE